MLNAIIKYALGNRLIILSLATLIIVAGLWQTQQIDVDVFPDLTAPTVTVMTEAHGMSAEEVERLLTVKLETALNGAPNVRRIRSSSIAGLSTIWAEFEWGVDIYKARQIVNERLSTMGSELPPDVDNPVMAPITSIMGEIQMVAITSETTSNMDLRTLADWYIKPAVLAVEGVAKIVIYGGDLKEYQVLASPTKMKYHKVSISELYTAIHNLNHNASGGFIEQYGQQYLISSVGRIKNITEIEEAFLKIDGDVAVRIGDVATVQINAAPKVGEGSVNGKNALILTILKQPGVNTLNLTQDLENTFENLAKNLPSDVKLDQSLFKQANFIKTSIDNLQQVLFEGIIFVIIILFLFLMEWRTTLISVLTIPLSIFASLLTLQFLGFSINTMTLGGLAIAVGVLVDDAVIDVENVYKRLRQNAQLAANEQLSKLKIIYDATFEVRSSILNSSLIIIASFIPLFFLSGVEGRLLQPLGVAFLVSIIASLFVAVTITPVLCSVLLKSKYKEKEIAKTYNSFITQSLLGIYKRILPVSLKGSYLVLLSAVLLLGVTVFTLTTLGRSFLPEFNEGAFTISAVAPPGTSLSQTNKIGLELEKALLTVPEIKLVGRRTGRAPLDEHSQSVYASEIEAPLVMGDRPKSEVIAEIREKIGNFSGVNVNIGQPLSHRIDHMLSGTRSSIAIKIFGDDLTKLFQTSSKIKNLVETVEGAVDVNMEQQIEIPKIHIYPKHEMLARHGISIEQFSDFVEIAIGGKVVSQVYEGQQSFNLTLRLEEKVRDELEKLDDLTIDNYKGEKVPFGQVVKIVSTSSPERINREKVKRKMVVSCNVAERDLQSVVEDIQKTIGNNIQLPEGYYIEYGGQFESAQNATQMLLITSLLALAIILVLLYKEFKEAWLSLIILLNLPLAMIGGVFMIYFDSGIISIASTIGFISLFGVATRNGMLLISRYQTLLEEGHQLLDAIIEGSLDRLNPILMTALTTGLALIPLVLAGGQPGNEIQSPMAVVILGGLLSSTLLNLVVIPSSFYLLKRRTKQ
ncbi:MAG: efflux RND transporter permease subunit [Aureispira sp.]|nr:efflux RND transporter permease subunit [Aureispira sp.]